MPKTKTIQASVKRKVTPEQIRRLLRKTDWLGHSYRVAERVARTAEGYRRASARSLQTGAQYVFM